jgi:hypothetical protein
MMAFSSSLPAGCLVVTEDNWKQFAKGVAGPDGESESGYIPRDYGAMPLGEGYAARRMPKEMILSEEDCIEIIKEREAKGTRLIDRCEKSGIFTLDQSPSWYCWCYSMTNVVMAAMISQNETPRLLSPESVAGPIMNYKKKGGWCSLARDYMAKNGIADTNAWPWESHKQANNPKYFKESRDNAAQTLIPEFWDLQDWAEKRSCLARGLPCGACYDYEGHATGSIELILRDGQLGCIDIDSYFVRNGRRFHARARMGSRAFSQDTVAVCGVTPNSLPPT